MGPGSDGKPAMQYARARVELIARDPALPRQAAILDPLPACSMTQLRVDAVPATTSTPVKMLRAYNASNVSEQACSLAGVPRTRGLDEHGNYQPFLRPVCPNCENESFMPRSNGRIDLRPGETAHLLVASTGNREGWCMYTPKLELSLDREAGLRVSANTGPLAEDIAHSVTVPFEGHDCVSMDVSAWRQGGYDGDPLNLRQAKMDEARDQAPPVPNECNKPELLVHGRPYPIAGTHEPEYAISMEEHRFTRDEPINLYLWTNNSTDHAIEIGGCGRLPGYFKAGGFVLYDAYGHRILNKRQVASDEQCKKDPLGYHEGMVCTLNVVTSLAAHTCIASRIDLARDYDLPPGEYTISTRDPGDTDTCPRRNEDAYKSSAATDIRFSVLQP
jgi:hypothetical protein